tara:strand:+ start:6643 stop:6843 length:201 start_codon:yes stop_codon:yes gene_type:complete
MSFKKTVCIKAYKNFKPKDEVYYDDNTWVNQVNLKTKEDLARPGIVFINKNQFPIYFFVEEITEEA